VLLCYGSIFSVCRMQQQLQAPYERTWCASRGYVVCAQSLSNCFAGSMMRRALLGLQQRSIAWDIHQRRPLIRQGRLGLLTVRPAGD